MKKIMYLTFLLIFSCIYFLIHAFVYTELVQGLAISGNLKTVILIVFITGGISYILGEILGRIIDRNPFIYFGAVFMGIISLSVAVFILNYIFRLIFPSLRFWGTAISLCIIFFLSIYSLINSKSGPWIKEMVLLYPTIPDNLIGLRIAHLSDVHLGKLTSTAWADKVVRLVNSQSPDLVCITGDLIDEDICHISEYCTILNKLNPRYGSFSVPGNHEYYAGISSFQKLCQNTGIKILVNSSAEPVPGLIIAGTDDETGERLDGEGPDLEKVFKKIDPDKFIILMSHQPRRVREAIKLGTDLQLSGHTHKGQMPPITFIVLLMFKYYYGLFKEGGSYIYTSSGVGTWGPPMRLFSRGEILVFSLEKKSIL